MQKSSMTPSNDWTPERLRALATGPLELEWLVPFERDEIPFGINIAAYPDRGIWISDFEDGAPHDLFPFSPTADDGRLLKWILEESAVSDREWCLLKSKEKGWIVFSGVDTNWELYAPTVTEAVCLALEENHGR